MAEASVAVESETSKFSPVVEAAAKVLFPDQNAVWRVLRETPSKAGELTAPLQSAYQWVDYQLNRFTLQNLIEVPADPSRYGFLPEKHLMKGRFGLPGGKRNGEGEIATVPPPATPTEISERWQKALAVVKAKIQAEAEQIDQQREANRPVLAGFEKSLQDLGLTDIDYRDLSVAYHYWQYRAGQIKEKSYYRFYTGRWGLVSDGRRVSIEMAVDKK